VKDLLETIGTILFVSFCLAILFVLQGEPSLWDLWQEAARRKLTC
jgi:hypothetical protein